METSCNECDEPKSWVCSSAMSVLVGPVSWILITADVCCRICSMDFPRLPIINVTAWEGSTSFLCSTAGLISVLTAASGSGSWRRCQNSTSYGTTDELSGGRMCSIAAKQSLKRANWWHNTRKPAAVADSCAAALPGSMFSLCSVCDARATRNKVPGSRWW